MEEMKMIEEESEAVGEWRTKDMAMAAYLSCLGHRYVRMELDEESCYWVFTETADLPDEVFTYLEGKATVEPGRFNSFFSMLKRDMFDFGRSQGVNFGRRFA